MALMRMLCPECASDKTRILDVRHRDNVDGCPALHIKRRWECRTCDHRWTTREIPVSFLEEVLAKARAYDEMKAERLISN